MSLQPETTAASSRMIVEISNCIHCPTHTLGPGSSWNLLSCFLNHRIIKCTRMRGSSKGPCSEQGHFQVDHIAQSPIKPDLECPMDGVSITSLSKLFQCSAALLVKIFFLPSNLNLPCFSLKSLPFVLLLQALLESVPIPLTNPFK